MRNLTGRGCVGIAYHCVCAILSTLHNIRNPIVCPIATIFPALATSNPAPLIDACALIVRCMCEHCTRQCVLGHALVTNACMLFPFCYGGKRHNAQATRWELHPATPIEDRLRCKPLVSPRAEPPPPNPSINSMGALTVTKGLSHAKLGLSSPCA